MVNNLNAEYMADDFAHDGRKICRREMAFTV